MNAVELNASFYRYPYPSQGRSWSRRGSRLRWAIKVHRSITHLRKLNEKALESWPRFRRLFEPLDHLIDFYLFQLPPNFSATERNIERLKLFSGATGLGWRMAVEFRHTTWFTSETEKLCRSLGVTPVSVDSPLGTWIAASGNGVVYLRMHGRTAWYAHDYTEEELRGVAEAVASLKPRAVYVFFNNNHWMLGNARLMLRILAETL